MSDQHQSQGRRPDSGQSPASGPRPMSGRVALVAGASKGIGAATAEAFAAAGAAVVLAARDTAALKAVADGIEARGGRALAVGADVTDTDSMRRLVDVGMSAFGRLDAAFNNASAGPMPAPLADLEPVEFDVGIATNIRGTFLGMKFQIPAMLASGGGAIVNMASIAGLNGTANLAAYVAGKAGIIGLTKVAALDYADQGIRVNVVAPGPILTYHLEQAGPQAQRGAALSTPMRRVGTPAEVARAVLWLCSDESSFITGTVMPIDGGQSAGNKPPQMYRQGQPMSDPPAAARPLRACSAAGFENFVPMELLVVAVFLLVLLVCGGLTRRFIEVRHPCSRPAGRPAGSTSGSGRTCCRGGSAEPEGLAASSRYLTRWPGGVSRGQLNRGPE